MSSLVLYEVLKVGSRVHPIEITCVYFVLPFLLAHDEAVADLFRWNLMCQAVWFMLVVQLPGAITGKMSYVDIGWPGGLCILALNCYYKTTTVSVRKTFVCGMLFLHGIRMFIGALIMFFPYTFPGGDLSRYKFAKWKWVNVDKLPESWWPFKQQQETACQGMANSATLATPIFMIVTNNTSNADELNTVEVAAIALWIGCFVLESMADTQKLKFLHICKMKGKQATSEKEKQEIKTAVLGFEPFDGYEYWLWSRVSRHPNYLFQWLQWVSYCIFAIPSIMARTEFIHICSGILGIYLVARLFYDCLVYWTGAEPAEFGSIAHRPKYREYQTRLPVLFPFKNMPFVDPHMEAGWPSFKNTQKTK